MLKNYLLDLKVFVFISAWLVFGLWANQACALPKKNCTPPPLADFNLDCNVNLRDYALLINQWLESVE